jgi:hypothetical protein
MGAAGPRVSEQPTYRRGAGSAVRGRKASFGRRDDKTDPPPRCNANTHGGARPLFEAGQKKLGPARHLETVENASKQEQTPRPSGRNNVPRADRFRNGACREPGDVDAGAPPLRVGPTNRPRSRSWRSGCRWAGLGSDAGSRPTGGGKQGWWSRRHTSRASPAASPDRELQRAKASNADGSMHLTSAFAHRSESMWAAPKQGRGGGAVSRVTLDAQDATTHPSVRRGLRQQGSGPSVVKGCDALTVGRLACRD